MIDFGLSNYLIDVVVLAIGCLSAFKFASERSIPYIHVLLWRYPFQSSVSQLAKIRTFEGSATHIDTVVLYCGIFLASRGLMHAVGGQVLRY